MKLSIERRQAIQTDRKGRSEGVRFELSCRLELDPHELELVERYSQFQYPVAMFDMNTVRDYRPPKPEDMMIRLDQLMNGWQISTRFVTDVLEAEGLITGGCEQFKKLLLTFESYGGSEEIEF
jgi:hypothetical protein